MDATSRPKPEPIDTATLGRGKKYPRPQTLKDYLTDNDSNASVLTVFRELAKSRRPETAKWKESWNFYKNNHTGDIKSFKIADKAKIDRIKKELLDELGTALPEDLA